MDRSLAGRTGFGGLIGQPARPRGGAGRVRGRKRAHGRKRTRRARPSARREANLLDRALAQLAGALSAGARPLRACGAFVWRRRRLRAATLALLLAVALLGGGWLWLRQSSLVAVEHVRVTGAHGSEASAIDAALGAAARRMTTLDVNAGALRAAVAGYPQVHDIRVKPSFPHGISIRVVEQPAVAVLSAGGAKVAVAADGTVLGPGLASGSLPVLSEVSPTGTQTPGAHLRNATALSELAVLGAAPARLANLVTRAYSGSSGLTLAMHSGLLVYFGDATRAHAKWLSLESVLASPDSAGASYVDVRVPERPAAGFPGGAAPPPSSTSESEAESESQPVGATDSESSQALEAGLSAAVGGGSTTGQTSTGGAGSSGGESQASGEPEAEASGQAEAPAQAESEH
jgi:cell division protein FtsQ